MVDADAFDGLDNLEYLLLGSNNIHRLTVSEFPKNLIGLELQENRLDLLPDLPDSFQAPKLRYLYVFALQLHDFYS
jgi:Leucine-rich repeat (LRR) protein